MLRTCQIYDYVLANLPRQEQMHTKLKRKHQRRYVMVWKKSIRLGKRGLIALLTYLGKVGVMSASGTKPWYTISFLRRNVQLADSHKAVMA